MEPIHWSTNLLALVRYFSDLERSLKLLAEL
jgi:hypothetical protein